MSINHLICDKYCLELHTALDPNGPDDNIYHKLNDLLTFTVDIYRLFVAEDSKTSIHNTTVRHWYGDDHGVTLSFADYLDEQCARIDKIIETKQAELEKMKAHRNSIIYDFVTGKKRVKEVM